MFVVKFISFIHLLNTVNADNILGLLGLTAYSHHLWNSVLFNELANKGHNVTILSVDLPKYTQDIPPNVTYIHLEKAYDVLIQSSTKKDILRTMGLAAISPIYKWSVDSTQGILESRGWNTLMDYPDNFKFDLIIFDYTIGNCLLGFVHKFNNPPLIGISPFLNNPAVIDLIGNPLFPAYVPHWSTAYDIQMNFLERIHNTMVYFWDAM